VELLLTPHLEPITIPRFVQGLKKVTVRGTYHPDVMALLRQLYEFGLLDQDLHVEAEGKRVSFGRLLIQALMGDGTERPKGINPLYLLRFRVTGDDRTSRRMMMCTVGHPLNWDPLPQGRMTSLSTSYTAQLVAAGELDYRGGCGPGGIYRQPSRKLIRKVSYFLAQIRYSYLWCVYPFHFLVG